MVKTVEIKAPQLLPDGWTTAQTFVFGLVLAFALNLGSDLYLKFIQPAVRSVLNAG